MLRGEINNVRDRPGILFGFPLSDTSAWAALDENRIRHLSHTLAPLLRFAITATWAELQFENLTEQLALAHLKADPTEIENLKNRIEDSLRLLPTDLPEVRPHWEALSFALSPGFWDHLHYTRIVGLQETLAPLMRFRGRRDRGQIIQISLPDEIFRRHWIVFGPGGEGSFAENYLAQVEALVLGPSEGNPALKKLRQGKDVTDEELASVSSILCGPDASYRRALFIQNLSSRSASATSAFRNPVSLSQSCSRSGSLQPSATGSLLGSSEAKLLTPPGRRMRQ